MHTCEVRRVTMSKKKSGKAHCRFKLVPACSAGLVRNPHVAHVRCRMYTSKSKQEAEAGRGEEGRGDAFKLCITSLVPVNLDINSDTLC